MLPLKPVQILEVAVIIACFIAAFYIAPFVFCLLTNFLAVVDSGLDAILKGASFINLWGVASSSKCQGSKEEPK